MYEKCLLYQSSELFALQDAQDAVLLGERKDDDGDVVVHREARGGRIHDREALREHLVVADLVVLDGRGVFARIVANCVVSASQVFFIFPSNSL